MPSQAASIHIGQPIISPPRPGRGVRKLPSYVDDLQRSSRGDRKVRRVRRNGEMKTEGEREKERKKEKSETKCFFRAKNKLLKKQ
jgi:hypothetical protein